MMKKIVMSVVAIALVTGLLTNQGLAQEPVQRQVEYTVQAGDWLSKIAEKWDRSDGRVILT